MIINFHCYVKCHIIIDLNFRWDRLSILMDRLAQYQEQFGYFLVSREGSVLAKQVNITIVEIKILISNYVNFLEWSVQNQLY